MGIYLNPGNQLFKCAVNSRIYVDKTMLLDITNSVISTSENHICVSRPRRFGKSMAANMLTSYYSKGCSSKELFNGLKISKTDNFEKHLNKYNVVRLDMQGFAKLSGDVDTMIANITEDLLYELGEEYPDIKMPPRITLEKAFHTVYIKTGIPFVFIIDEWDCVFRVYKTDKRGQEIYLEFLRNLFKEKPYVALDYATGILPVKKYGKHSTLNMYQEFSMANQAYLAEYTGFTTGEVERLCSESNMSIDDMKKWYDGYMVNGYEIFNPQSVVTSVSSKVYDNYWTKTETFEALKEYIYRDFNGLRQKIVQMISGEHIPIEVNSFQNDMVTFNCADDILTLLIHLGYLTYDIDTKTAWIPNNEVLQEFVLCVKHLEWQEVTKSLQISDQLMKATLDMDSKRVAQIIEEAHEANTSILKYSDENSLACVLSLAYYSARNDYIIHRELASGKGFADLAFIPRKNTHKPAIIAELKHNKTAAGALQQIKAKNYPQVISEYSGEILLVGINYDENKEHTCIIEKIEKND